MGGDDSPAQGSDSAMIDKKSMADYRQQVESQRLQNRNATEVEICFRVKEYIKKRLDGIVDEECRKRVMDLTTVALSCLSSMVIPFSGVAVVVAATVIQCINFAITLGLIPLLNVRSFNDLMAMTKQIASTIKRAGKSSLMAAVETAVLEILKKLGLNEWLWVEILRDVLFEMIGDSAMDAGWVMTPLLAVPKYMMHRHLIKKMYRKLGDKANIVHTKWMEQNCITTVGAQTTVVTQVAGGEQVDSFGNVQGSFIQEVTATQLVASNGDFAQVSQTNGYNYQQQATYPPSNQAPSYNPTPGMMQGYPPQSQQQMPPANLFQPLPAAKSTGTVIMGYTPPANSSFFQPQTRGSQVSPQAVGNFQCAAAATQICTPQPNPTYIQQLPPYDTKQVQQMYLPQGQPRGNPYVQMGDSNKPQEAAPAYGNPKFHQGQPRGNPYVQMGDYNKPQAQTLAYPPAVYNNQASAPQLDLWYKAQA